MPICCISFSSLLIGKFSGSDTGDHRGRERYAFQFPPHREVLWQLTIMLRGCLLILFQFPPHREVLWQRLSLVAVTDRGSAFQFPPHREVLWQGGCRCRRLTSTWTLSVPSSSGSSLAVATVPATGITVLSLSVPSSSGSSLAVYRDDSASLPSLIIFQFPPHREVLWQADGLPVPVQLRLSFSSLLIGKFSGSWISSIIADERSVLSVPSSSGSSLAASMPIRLSRSLLSVPSSSGSSLAAASASSCIGICQLSVPSSSGSSLAGRGLHACRTAVLSAFSSLLIGKFSGRSTAAFDRRVVTALSVPSSSGSSLADRDGEMIVLRSDRFQFPPHREVLWQS